MSNGLDQATPFADYDATYAYSRMGGKTSERAVLIVNGTVFEDWETVAVIQAAKDGPPGAFRFTCSEPLAKSYAAMQIKPGMSCVIYLAGYKAFSGKVVSRQVFYDSRRHYIEIQGSNYAFVAMQTSVISKTQEFKKVNYKQLMSAIMKPLNVPFKVEGKGSLPNLIFDRVAIPPGQYAWDLAEQYARQIGVPLTSNSNGDFVALAGPREGTGNDFVEGQNILEGREIIVNRAYENTAGQGQMEAKDKKWGPPTTSVPFIKDDPTGLIPNQVQQSGYAVIQAEVPVTSSDKEHLKARNNFEGTTLDEDSITVWVTVYGWLKTGGGGLWGPVRSPATVKSPMLTFNSPKQLMIEKITFTQDNRGGTRTQLELKNAAAGAADAGRGRIDELPTANPPTNI